NLINGVPIGVKLSNGILKHLLGQEKNLDWTDLEHFDEKMFHTFKRWMDDTPTPRSETHQTYGLHFAIYDNVSKSEVLLCEHGDQIELTNENKARYVYLYTKHRLTLNVTTQLQGLQKGFWSLLPCSVVHKFLSVDNLRQALTGSDELNILYIYIYIYIYMYICD
ncbi:ubiquitin transferase, HECT domain family protein, partial [Reticulomyxa filosa]